MKLIPAVTGLAVAAALLATAACGSSTAASAPSTVTVSETHTIASAVPAVRFTSTVTATVTATATVTGPAQTVTAAAPAAAANADPSGPKSDGNYLVPLQITPGSWQCSKGDEDTFWRASNSSAETIDNGFSTIATIPADAFSADLKRCDGIWTLVA